MGLKAGCAAVFAAFLITWTAAAQDVTLVAREGGIVLTGSLQGFDGEFYRIQTSYGMLTVDGQGVICEGPACPDLIAPKAVIRLTGAPDAGKALLPGLFRAFAVKRGLVFQLQDGPEFAALILDPETDKVLAEISFVPEAPDVSAEALASGRAELVVAARPEKPFGTRALAFDALVPVVAPDNPTPEISTAELAQVLSGEVKNWAVVGGPDMPIVLHALRPDTDLQRALSDRLGSGIVADVLHPDLASMADAVAKDPWALAITGRAGVGAARVLPLTDSCGFPLLPSALAVKAEDYPLALPIFLLTPPRRLPLMAREFLEFLATPAAQAVVAQAGYVDRSASRQPMTADGLRLINAIQGAGDDITLADLKRLVNLMDGADRLSLTFRFEDGSSTLDAQSQDNLADLARLIASGQFRNEEMVLAGFSDGSGAADANLALSIERAARVAQELSVVAPDLVAAALPRVEGFGEALPMACDETPAGRHLNRRVELWLVPRFTDTPPSEN
ncbi:phosphate ABC transporter substrate-binding/OmpA family protein [Tabrizicola sp.]|uniref:phosphate ABC transporter substrate-binding/OmpA family protein n=1 Tax=Tabrizicola sp. TaxID=2005166 RepID=UPI00286D1E0A|nr:phosphate ABC transporter substrate-binding/OmpA family protein [Tabrizicola sp.]